MRARVPGQCTGSGVDMMWSSFADLSVRMECSAVDYTGRQVRMDRKKSREECNPREAATIAQIFEAFE